MKELLKYSIMIISLFTLLGCSSIDTKKATLGSEPEGIRVFYPKVYLFVSHGNAPQTVIKTLPDLQHAYDIKPSSFLSKQGFTIELSEGQLIKLAADQDTTAALTFLGDMAKLGADLAKKTVTPVSEQTIEGTLGLPEGIYTFNSDGKLIVVDPPNNPNPTGVAQPAPPSIN